MPIIGAPTLPLGPGDSRPGTFSTPGSGFAVPAGLEAVLEYNGLFLNVRDNIERYHVTSIDGLGDADIRDTRDSNTDDDGETPYNSFLGGKTLVIGGTIRAHSVPKLRDMQMALRAAFADRSKERPLHFRVGDFTKDHFINVKKIAPIAGIEQQGDLRANRDFQITVRASNPRFLSFLQKFFVATPTASIVSVALGDITNSGDYFAQPVYRIYGPSNSTTILNATIGTSFTVNGIVAGDYYDFDTAKKKLKNSSGSNQWKFLSDDSKYVLLQGQSGEENPTGLNHIYFTGDSPRIEISWYDSWI